MEPGESRRSRLRRRLILSAVAVVFGIVMMLAPLTPFGPSPLIGLVFGGALVLYGALRAYQTLKR